jgi:hypothetical protein
MTLLNNFRQFLYPREFRIAEPAWSDETIIESLQQIAELLAKKEPESPKKEAPTAARAGFLADVSTGLWRLRQKMVQPGSDRPLDEMRRAYRHFESVWDALANEGVQIYDHTGENFDSGKQIKVLAFQPTPGLNREKVLETVKPTIYVKDQLVQMGEVYVGTPEEKEQ